MINNTIPKTESFICAASHAILHDPFLAVENDIFIGGPSHTGAFRKLLKVVGYEEITAATCERFRKAACAAWEEHTDVEIDLSHTALIDCAGLGALIAVRNLTRERKGVARLMNPAPPVQQLLDLTRAGQLFDIVNTPGAPLAFSAAMHN